ncbi:MAG TPA: DoxX family protein [Flavisolibacter sp.]|jgi:putative oxidoreductase|nr:DoxX family protein [Flavisolibacter sp.]
MPEQFGKNTDAGILLLRLFVGVRLIYGVQDNILHWSHMKTFEAFLAAHHFPLPIVSAIVSVYAQAIAGVLFIIGWQVRWAALFMIINFSVALIMVHWGQTFEQMTTVLFMLVSSLVLLLSGAGRYSLQKA